MYLLWFVLVFFFEPMCVYGKYVSQQRAEPNESFMASNDAKM